MKRTFSTLNQMYRNHEIDAETLADMANELDLFTRDGIKIYDAEPQIVCPICGDELTPPTPHSCREYPTIDEMAWSDEDDDFGALDRIDWR